MKRVVFAASLLLAFAGAASGAQYYKWKDQNGVWQYTTTAPPAGAESKTVSVPGAVDGSAQDSPAIEPNQTDSPAQTAQAAQVANADGTKTAVDPAMTAEIKARREAACKNAKERADVLLKSAAVELDKNGDGVAEPLSAEEQSAELSKAQQSVRIYCNG